MPRKSFLIVTENEERGRALEALAARLGAQARRKASPSEALAELARRGYAAVFLDADSREAPGLPLCRRLRGELPPNSCALILFGSPRGSDWLVRGLDNGADDFWAYPFNAPVCSAYLGAILRRVSRLGTTGEPMTAGDLKADPVSRQATLRGKPLTLRAKEFDLLYLLLRQQGKALSREYLMEEAWGQEYYGTTRTIDFHVSQLRRKLGSWGARIQTVARTGYRFKGP